MGCSNLELRQPSTDQNYIIHGRGEESVLSIVHRKYLASHTRCLAVSSNKVALRPSLVSSHYQQHHAVFPSKSGVKGFAYNTPFQRSISRTKAYSR